MHSTHVKAWFALAETQNTRIVYPYDDFTSSMNNAWSSNVSFEGESMLSARMKIAPSVYVV